MQYSQSCEQCIFVKMFLLLVILLRLRDTTPSHEQAEMVA